MARLARRASLLVAFSLLTSAATAHAECAWVLWSAMESDATPQPPREPLYGAPSPVDFYDTRAACEKAAREEREKRYQAEVQDMQRLNNDSRVPVIRQIERHELGYIERHFDRSTRKPEISFAHSWRCFPDT